MRIWTELFEYACFDVLLWTGRYGEAKLIPGKPQSMELNRDTIQGEWKTFDRWRRSI